MQIVKPQLSNLCKNCIRYFSNKLINTGRVLTTSLSHIRTAATATANNRSKSLDKVTSMSTFGNNIICCHCNNAYLISTLCADDNNNT